MELVARPYLAAGVVVAAAGMIAVTPTVLPSVPNIQMPDIQLTSGGATAAGDVLSDLLSQQLGSNSALVDSFFASNASLVEAQAGQVSGLAELLAGEDGRVFAAEYAVKQLFYANNAWTGGSQASLMGLLGVRGTLDDNGDFSTLDLEGLNESLLFDARDASSPFGGLESAIGHYAGAAYFGSLIPADATFDEHQANEGQFDDLVASVIRFNDELLEAEHNFNTELVGNQIDLQQAMFGTDSAFNGVLNRGFNAFNMMYDAQQQSLNGFLGITGYDPQEYTDALLTGSGEQVFNDGSVGGLMGMFDQSAAMWANIGGLLTGADTGIPDGFTADAGEVSDAFTALMTTLGGGPFGDVFASGGAFSELLVDLSDMMSGVFG